MSTASRLSRSVLVLVASAVAVSAAETPPAKRAGKKQPVAKQADGPFADVPRGHWAHDAVDRAVKAGILQGWNNRFHGGAKVTRYQMAVVVARMVDRVGVLSTNGRVFTGTDIANLEALVIEFAEELALLNVKVSTLEDTLSAVTRDVDLMKSQMRGSGAKAGISGTAQVRAVYTSDADNAWGSGNFLVARTPAPSANLGVTRYHGGAVSGSGTPADPFRFDNRKFVSVSNFALNVDRQFDPSVHFHAQVDINAEGSRDASGAQSNAVGYVPVQPAGTLVAGTPPAGRGENFSFNGQDILINEAYVTWTDWWGDGVAARLGVFALPMNTEVNGPSRTYQWTVTPSVTNAKWESIRPVGLELFQHSVKDRLAFHVGAFTPGDTVNGVPRSGTLLSAPTAFSAVPFGATIIGGPSQLDPATNPGGTAFGFGRFPTPLASVMTDGPRGVEGQTLSSNDIGFYGMVGGHPTNPGHTGLSWQGAYFDRNGNMRRGADGALSLTDWRAWQVALSYQWRHFVLAAQYFDARSKNFSTADVATAVDPRRLNTTPFINAGGEDTASRAFTALVNWQWSRRGSFSFRFENPGDQTGLAELTADIYTAAMNWRASEHGWLQLEWIESRAEATSENGFFSPAGICDDQVQLNYKLNW